MADARGQLATFQPRVAGQSALSTTLVVALTIGALYVGSEIFIPLALAIMLSFVLAPLVSWVQRWRVPKVAAVVGVVALAVTAFCIFAFVVAGQLTQLAGNLPGYQANIQAKIREVKITGAANGVFSRLTNMVQQIDAEVTKPTASPAQPGSPATVDDDAPPLVDAPPVQVEIAPSEASPIELLQTWIGPLVSPFVTAGVVLIFVIFILLQRQDLRDRFIRLTSAGDLIRTTQALEDAGSRVADFLLMQLIVNVSFGVTIGIGLWVIGVPNPILWGALAAVLRFVPYIGPILAAIFPIALSIAVDSGWTMVFWTIALFILIELLSNNILEPWLYGSKTGLSPLAILVAAIFWTWLWGAVGLLLATPLTVCLIVLGRHVPQFAFLDVLLGSEPVLSPSEQLHQRLLALNSDEATLNAEEFLEKRSIVDYYSEVFIPALAALEYDRSRGALRDDRRLMVVEGVHVLIDNLSYEEDPQEETNPSAPTTDATSLAKSPTIWCVGGRGNLDDAAAASIAQLAERRGISARRLPFTETHPSRLANLGSPSPDLICLIYLNENSVAHAASLSRRFRRHLPSVPIAVAILSASEEEQLRKVSDASQAVFVASSVAELMSHIDEIVRKAPPELPQESKAATATEGISELSAA